MKKIFNLKRVFSFSFSLHRYFYLISVWQWSVPLYFVYQSRKYQFLKFKCSFSVENTVREYTNKIFQHFIMSEIENKHGIFVIAHWKNSLISFSLTISRYFAATTSFKPATSQVYCFCLNLVQWGIPQWVEKRTLKYNKKEEARPFSLR